MADVTYRPNQEGLRALANGPEVRAMLREIAEKAKAHAESIAPVDTGEYAGAFRIVETTVEIDGRPRAAARLENFAPHAAAVEWANAQDPTADRVLGRTLDALGRL